MTNGIRIAVLVFVIAVNGAALGTLDISMVEFAGREKLALEQAPRIVVVESRAALSPLATSNCPAPKTL